MNNKRIIISTIVSSIIITNGYALTLDEKRAAALESLGVSSSKTTTTKPIVEVKNNDLSSKSIEDRIKYLEEQAFKDKNNEIETLKNKISELENKLNNNTIGGSSSNVSDKKLLKLETAISNLEKQINDSNLPEYRKDLNKLLADFESLNENGGSNEDIEDLEKEISKVKESSKYQLYKISSLEDATYDLEDRINIERNKDIQWHGDFKVGYGMASGQDKAVDFTKTFLNTAVNNGTFDPNMVDIFANAAERKDAFDGEGRLVGSQILSSNLSWLFQLNLTNISWINVDKSNKEGSIRPYMERGYIDMSYDNSLKLRVGADWVRNTIWSDRHFVGETLNSLAPLYHGEIFPTFNIGAEVLGILSMGESLLDYNVMIGNGDANIMETNTEKLITARLRWEFPLFDMTRISVAGGYSTETKDDPELNDNYNKLMYSIGLEQKIGNLNWNSNLVIGKYDAQQEGLEDYTKTGFNASASYTLNSKIIPWIMYDYMDREKLYGVDLLPIGIATRDINGQLYTYLSDMYDVEKETRIGLGVNYIWNQYFITKFEHYISDVKGNSTLFTFALQF